jgi:hypothetical protein|tara:strand:- start:576 stop:1070 length:495 start_codon:yes stop_codon:yes gene_type:complete
MAADRISKETADLVALPPYEWEVCTVRFLLYEPKIMENIERVPVNEPLVKSVTENGIMNPILCMPNYYPIAGSQRMRALVEVVKTNPEFYEKKINVCRFTKEWWNLYYLWSDKEFRDKAIAIWFQMAELVWKSKYYDHDTDGTTKMTEFEELGDTLKWEHKNGK